ncbi:MAG: hypothetical protein M3N43_03545 [Actinomycetota bacterium]|nr:hypothetical protein [Actinomycetota bacterium]
MSANRQVTIGRRWGHFKPSHWGQIRPSFSYRTIKTAKAINPRRGEELEQTLTGGGLYHAGSRARVHRPTRIGQNMAGRFVAAPWRAWRDGIFAVERVIEELPQYAAVGKALRQDTQLQGSVKGLLKLTDDQVNHFAENLVTDRALEARIQKGSKTLSVGGGRCHRRCESTSPVSHRSPSGSVLR